MEKIQWNSNEKVAREISGIEGEAKHFVVNGESAEELLKREAATKFNQQVDDYVQKFEEYNNAIQQYAEQIAENAANLEIMPILDNVLVKPFDENPFQRIKVTSSGLITDLGGQKPVIKSKDTGEFVEEEQMIHVGTILEVGKECKYAKEGDTIMWTKVSEVPVPFFKQGLVLLPEKRIMVIINEGLKERFYGK
jgi:co-chaperonin GroES (HSP10)